MVSAVLEQPLSPAKTQAEILYQLKYRNNIVTSPTRGSMQQNKIKLYRFKKLRNMIIDGIDVGDNPKVSVKIISAFEKPNITPKLFLSVNPIPTFKFSP